MIVLLTGARGCLCPPCAPWPGGQPHRRGFMSRRHPFTAPSPARLGGLRIADCGLRIAAPNPQSKATSIAGV